MIYNHVFLNIDFKDIHPHIFDSIKFQISLEKIYPCMKMVDSNSYIIFQIWICNGNWKKEDLGKYTHYDYEERKMHGYGLIVCILLLFEYSNCSLTCQ